MVYTFDAPQAADRHLVQYFEILGNRGVYYDGWFAGTIHMAPWEGKPRHPLTEDIWELYNVREDFSMAVDLAARHPEKLKELQSVFLAEAVKYKVLPIDDRRIERINPKLAGRPDLIGDRKSITVYEGLGFLLENDFLNTKNTSFEIVAEVEVTDSMAEGVIIAQGGRFGGWSFYVKDGKPVYAYNYLGLETYAVRSDLVLPKGKSTVKMDFAYDGKPKLGGGGTATLFVNGEQVGSGRIEQTQCCIWSADETANVGIDRETPVMAVDYSSEEPSRFMGKIDKVMINLK